MKKFIIQVVLWMLGMVWVAIVNNVVLLKIHPLEFYYTPTGLMISAIVATIEALILYPLSWCYLKKAFSKLYEESTKKES